MATPEDGNTSDGTLDDSTSGSSTPTPPAPSQDAPITRAQFDQFRQDVDQRISRINESRSQRDKGLNRVNERVDGLDGQMQAVLKAAAKFIGDGATPQEALDRATLQVEDEGLQDDLRSMARDYRAGRLAGLAGPGVTAQSIAAEFQLDQNTPEWTALVAEYGSNPIKLSVEASKLAEKRSATAPSSPLTAAPQQSANPPKPVSNDAAKLQADYDAAKQKILQTTRAGDGRIRALAQLKVQFREKGLAV